MLFQLYRPSLRAAAAIIVLIAWVASLGWLGVRRLGQTEETTLSNQATLRLAPGTAWYAVYAGPTQIGNAAITLDTLSPGYRIAESVMLAEPVGTGLIGATRRTEVWLGSTLNVERMASRYSREGRQTNWDVTVLGDTLTARYVEGSRRALGHALFDGAPTAIWVVPYRLALGGGLTPGHRRTILLLDSWPLAGAATAVTVAGDTMMHFSDSSRFDAAAGHWLAVREDSARAYPVTVNGPSGPRRFWVDHHGAIARIVTTLGVEWRRTDFDLSETDFRNTERDREPAIRAAIPVIHQFAMLPGPRDTGTATRRFVVEHRDGTPVDTTLLAWFAGGRQSVHGDTIVVQAGGAMIAGERARDTLPDPDIQTDPAPIVAAERRLVQRPVTTEELPHFLAEFHALVQVDTAASAAEDAIGSLRKPARPDGVARLFVALLRASNVPARYVVGVYPRGDTLWTHAWAEVWNPVSNGWDAVDPVTGAVTANTGLIRLAFAGSSHPDDLLQALANARFIDVTTKDHP